MSDHNYKERTQQIRATFPLALIGFIDDEAKKLQMNRGQYLEYLCMKDYEEKTSRKLFLQFVSSQDEKRGGQGE